MEAKIQGILSHQVVQNGEMPNLEVAIPVEEKNISQRMEKMEAAMTQIMKKLEGIEKALPRVQTRPPPPPISNENEKDRESRSRTASRSTSRTASQHGTPLIPASGSDKRKKVAGGSAPTSPLKPPLNSSGVGTSGELAGKGKV
jgi:hypothetical protein